MKPKQTHIKKDSPFAIFIWALYDFANTIYSMNVVSLYFPLLITVNLGFPDIWVSVANSVSMAIVVISMPFFGAFSDKIGRRMPFLTGFTLLAIFFTFLIGFFMKLSLPPNILVILICGAFVIANFGYQGGLVFYNTLLSRVASCKKRGSISGFGVAFGYLGSILGMLLVLPFNEGRIFSLDIPFIHAGGRQATFLPTAILFLIFAIPTLIYFREKKRLSKPPSYEREQPSLKLIWQTITNPKKYPGMGRFLLANFFYNDGVQTAIIFMAVFARKIMGLSDGAVTGFLIFSTVGAFAGSIIIGKISDRIGHKKALSFVLLGWIASLFILAAFPISTVLWILGIPIGALLGGVWTCARPIVLHLSPVGDEGRYFGLYAFSGKLAAIVGPLVWGGITLSISPISENLAYRVALLSLAGLIGIGAWLLKGLQIPERV